jgi:cell division protein YceG involved in septum cleavage
LASLRAAADAAVTDYLFFVADCDPDQPGAPRFSTTYEDHLENVSRCR